MEQLTDLPPLALAVFGGTLAVIFAVRYFGILAGANASPEKKQSSAQVAAVIVDPTALNNATKALEAHTYESTNLRKSIERTGDNVVEAIDDMTRTLTALKEEMIRKGR